LIDEGETEPGLPLVRVSVEVDRKGEARRRAVRTGLSLVGETFPRLIAVGMASNVDRVAAACDRDAEMIDGALPKILCAEETGDPVSDLYEAPATIERVVIEPAANKGVECPEAAVAPGESASMPKSSRGLGERGGVGLCSESGSSKASRRMT